MVQIVMTFCRFRHDENFKAVGDPQYAQIRSTGGAKGINAEVQMLRDSNEMDKYTPWTFVRVDELEVV